MKKHILFIVENNSVLDDPRVWNEAQAVKQSGYDVSVICPLSQSEPVRLEEIDGIKIYRHRIPVDLDNKLSFLFEYGNALLWEFFLSLKIFLIKPFHCIHSANPPDHVFLIAILFKLLGVKFIFDHHDLSPELFQVRFSSNGTVINRILLLFEKLSCKLADVIISTNNSYRRIVIERHKLAPDKVFVVRNDPRKDLCASTDSFGSIIRKGNPELIKILYLGRINPQDGVDVLMEVVDYLLNTLEETRFVCKIVGDGSSLETVRKLSDQLKIGSKVEFKGSITDRSKIRYYLETADICVEPAPLNGINKHSTFIKNMEYMAAGKPIVAFDLAETRYSVGGAALLVKPGSIPDFAREIQTLIENPELRRQKGRIGYKRIQKELNWDFSKIQLERAYHYIGLS